MSEDFFAREQIYKQELKINNVLFSLKTQVFLKLFLVFVCKKSNTHRQADDKYNSFSLKTQNSRDVFLASVSEDRDVHDKKEGFFFLKPQVLFNIFLVFLREDT